MNRPNNQALFAFAGLLLISILSCSYHEDKHPLTSGVGEQTGTPAEKATYSYINKFVLTPSCVRCHKPGGSAEDAALDTYDAVQDYLKKGDGEGSSMVQLMRSGKMPRGGGPKIPKELIDAVSEWITAGADNN